MIRPISVLLKSLTLILFTATLFIAVVTCTTFGSSVLVKIMEHFTDDSLIIRYYDGSLFRGMHIKKLTFTGVGIKLNINDAYLRLSYHSIFKRKIILSSLEIDGVNLRLYESQASAKADTKNNTNLSDYFDIEKANINHIHIIYKANNYLVNRVRAYKKHHHYQLLLQSNIGNINAEALLDKNITINWSAVIPDLSLLLVDLKGNFKSNGNITGTYTHPAIHADITINKFLYDKVSIKQVIINATNMNNDNSVIDTNIKVGDFKSDVITFNKISSRIDVSLNKKYIDISAKANADDSIKLKATAKLPDLRHISDRSQKVMLKLLVESSNINHFVPLNNVVDNISGNILLLLDINGTFKHPTIALSSKLINSSVGVPKIGMHISKINMIAVYHKNALVDVNGSMMIGSGMAQLKGTVDLEKSHNVDINLSGTHLDVANTKEYKIRISPNLNLKISDNMPSISGTINVPFAKISPIVFDDSITIPDETIFLGEKEKTPPFYSQISLSIKTKFGNDVFVKYDDLKANVNGELTINKLPNASAIASGDLYINDGSYRAYGIELAIKTGKVSYSGGILTNPGLYIDAAKTIKSFSTAVESPEETASSNFSVNSQVVVGVKVRGTASNPVVKLYSVPGGLSQKDILSYLLFGYPASQVSSSSALSMLNKLLPGGAGGGITDKFQDMLGLSDVSVTNAEYVNTETNTPVKTSAVNVGKNFGRNLSVHYSVGLLYPVSVLNIVYKISKRFSLKAETSTVENGTDLIYSIES